jgi:hypothetical protein
MPELVIILSAVLSCATRGGEGGGDAPEHPSKLPMTTVRKTITICVSFIRFTFQNRACDSVFRPSVHSGFQQLIVKPWLMRPIQIKLPNCSRLISPQRVGAATPLRMKLTFRN